MHGTERDGVVLFRLDSPRTRNALDSGMLEYLALEIRDVPDGDGVRGVVLTGTGPVFSSGEDLRETHTLVKERGMAALSRLFEDITEAVLGCPVPCVAALNGCRRPCRPRRPTETKQPASTYIDTIASAAHSTNTRLPNDLRGRGFRLTEAIMTQRKRHPSCRSTNIPWKRCSAGATRWRRP